MSDCLHITRTFQAPVERVYGAWTKPEDLRVWVWGANQKDSQAVLDLRVGGEYAFSVHAGNTSERWGDRFTMRGMYVYIVPNERLVYTVHWDAPVEYNEVVNPPPDEFVHVVIKDDKGATHVNYEHYGIPSEAAIDGHRKGIEHTFDVLGKLLEGQ